jgi:Tfp pilus assembly protein FimT
MLLTGGRGKGACRVRPLDKKGRECAKCRSGANCFRCAHFGSSPGFFDGDQQQNAEQIGIMRRGTSLLEMVMVITLVGLLSSLAVPRMAGWMDRLAVRRASEDVASFYQAARFAALLRGSRVRMELRPDSLNAWFEGRTDSLFRRRAGPAQDGVRLNATRTVVRILPNGIGSGGSNTTLVFRRGVAAESLTTSRLGRLKRWR